MNDMVGHIRSNLYMTIYDIFQGLLPNWLPNPSLIYLFIHFNLQNLLKSPNIFEGFRILCG